MYDSFYARCVCVCVMMLYIDLRPGETCHSKVMHRKKVTHSDGSYEKKSRRQPWLTIWDKVKSHGTLIDWCTRREWPLNSMTVISAWWWSNMPVQTRRKWHIPAWLAMRIDIEWAIELLYNSVETGSQWVGDQMSWSQDMVGKATTQQKGPSEPPMEFGDQTSWCEETGMRTCPREAPGWAAQGNENDTWRCPEGLGRSICSSLCSVSNSLSHATFQIKWVVYFFNEVFARLYYCVNMSSACICVYV